MKPTLDPAIPFDDRVLITLLWRMAEDARAKRDRLALIRATKALAQAVETAKSTMAEAQG